AIAIKLSRPHIRKKDVPDLVGLFRYRDPDIFLGRIDIIEEAKIDRGRVLGKNREVDSVAEPGRSERIGIAEPNFYRRHKTSVFYPLRARPWQRMTKFSGARRRVCCSDAALSE